MTFDARAGRVSRRSRGSRLAPLPGMPVVSLQDELSRSLIVVSNREPYEHTRRPDGPIEVAPTTGGVSVALDALMRERGGTWIAAGSGNADAEVVDAHDRVEVPARRAGLRAAASLAVGGRRAALLRWFRERRAVAARPHRPRPAAVPQRGLVGVSARQQRFAAAVASELTDERAPVFIQDYHLALVAAELRAARAGGPDGVLLAHPVAASRPPADLPVARGNHEGASGQRSAGVPARARPPELPARGPGGARRRRSDKAGR